MWPKLKICLALIALLGVADRILTPYISSWKKGVEAADQQALETQIRYCWKEIKVSDQQAVGLLVNVKWNREIGKINVIDNKRYETNKAFRDSADAAIAALNSPKCHKLNLSFWGYEDWKELNLTFDPR